MKLWENKGKEYNHLLILGVISPPQLKEDSNAQFYSLTKQLQTQNTIWAIAHKASIDFSIAKQIVKELLSLGIVAPFYSQESKFIQYKITEKGFEYLFRLRYIKEVLSGK